MICLPILALLVSFSLADTPPRSEAKDFAFTQVDLKLLQDADEVDRQLEKRGVVYTDPGLDAFLEEIGRTLVPQTTPDKVRWRFHILRDPSVNAFALPNGSIYFHTGLLSLLENEAQLAGVFAHEIAHVQNRHTYLHFRSYRKKMVALHVISAATSWAPVGSSVAMTAISVVGAVSQAVLVATVFGYSQELEREADRFAVERLAELGYDPAEMTKSFKLLDEKLEVEPVETFYRSHPKLTERQSYTASLAAGKTITKARSVDPDEYLSRFEKVIRLNIELDMDTRRFRTAVARAQRLVNLRPKNAENTFWVAEAYRTLGPRAPEPTEKELTGGGQAAGRRNLSKRTLDEERKELLNKPQGPQALRANHEKAEELYRKALSLDPPCPRAHRGLGMLYQEQGRDEQALENYRKYLELSPDASDRPQIEHRIEILGKSLKTPTG